MRPKTAARLGKVWPSGTVIQLMAEALKSLMPSRR